MSKKITTFINNHKRKINIYTILLLVIFSSWFLIMSEETFVDRLALIIISWIMFLIAYGGFFIILKAQANNLMITPKAWDIIICFFLLCSSLLAIRSIIAFIICYMEGYYMAIHPLHAIMLAVVNVSNRENNQ